MRHKLRPLLILVIIIAVLGGGSWYFNRNPAELIRLQQQFGLSSQAEGSEGNRASGFVEAEEISIAPEIGGRITRLLVDEGDFVEVGQVLIELDPALLEAEIAQAQAKVETAQARLAKIEAGIRVEEMAKAEAAIALAEANAQAAHILWQNAIMLRDNPQELDRQIDAAKTALELANLQIASAIPLKDAGEAVWELRGQQWDFASDSQHFCGTNPITSEKMCQTVNFPEGVQQDIGLAWNYAGADMWAAWVDLNSAIAQQPHAETALNDLLLLRNDPQEAAITVTEAQAAYETAQVEVEVGKAQLAALKTRPRAEEISLAQAQVQQAEANLATLQVQLDKHTLVAPLAGWIVEAPAHEGEMAPPGAPLLTLVDLSKVTLTVYVAEPDIDTISLNQEVDVFVDTFPEEPFSGRLIFINNEAEFTPKNVQTKEERTSTVFAVKITLDNEDQRLKPGMPADAVFPKGPSL